MKQLKKLKIVYKNEMHILLLQNRMLAVKSVEQKVRKYKSATQEKFNQRRLARLIKIINLFNHKHSNLKQ